MASFTQLVTPDKDHQLFFLRGLKKTINPPGKPSDAITIAVGGETLPGGEGAIILVPGGPKPTP